MARASRPGVPREVVEVVEADLPEPGPGEALVRVAAAAVNQSEVLALRGGPYAQGLTWPVPLGYEGSGTVVGTGERVCWTPAAGSCADLAVLPRALLVPVPDALELTAAARVASAGLTASLLADVVPLEGRSAVVWGAAGPVGRMLTAVLAEGGAEVIGIASGPGRTAAARAAGAAHTVDRSAGDVARAVAAYTGGAGVAAVFDPVGGPTYRTSLALLGRRGCLVNYGDLADDLPRVDLMDLMDKGVFVTKFGGAGAGLDGVDHLRRLVGEALDLAVRRPPLVADGGMFELAEAAEAYEAVRSGPPGKVLVVSR
ncbi:zinc-binding dehydrogenase [Streptomyces sp. 8L]|uniref:zinc-binding dehydrogenase n=1 Tax=Streptomyces sp. 8L TaxID=2877242 RepID=UPI001CD38F72|nr:zinc-binding dehydrogenase [Streptomyces sp. 8L]MCA1220584.1 zinc-binding dehydrogenase [Streptomyces sp. 8L]